MLVRPHTTCQGFIDLAACNAGANEYITDLITRIVGDIREMKRRTKLRPKTKQNIYQKQLQKIKQNAQPPKTQTVVIEQPQNPNDYGPLGNFVNPYLQGSGSLIQALARGGSQFLNTLSGRGLYKLRLNSIMQGSIPTFVTSNENSVRMAGVEYLGKLVVPSTNPSNWAVMTGFDHRPINPTDQALFPVLAAQVKRIFRKWKPWGIVYYLKSLAGTAVASNNPAIGVAMGAIKSNSNELRYATEQEMLNSSGKRVVKNNEDMLLPVECSPMVRPTDVLFMETGSGTTDLKTVTVGSLTLATSGCPNGGATHQVYCAYDIEFFDRNPTTSTAPNTHFILKTDVSTTNYFGSDYATKLPTFTSDFNGTADIKQNRVALGQTTIVFDPTVTGTVKIEYIVHGASGAIVNPTLTPSAGATGVNDLLGDTGSSFSQNGTMVALHVVAYYLLNGGGTITFSGATFPASVDAADLYISPVDDYFS